MNHLSRIVRDAHKRHEKRTAPGASENPPGSMPSSRPWVWRKLLSEREASSVDSPHGESYDGPTYEHEDEGVWAQYVGLDQFGEQQVMVSAEPRIGDYLIEPEGRPQNLQQALQAGGRSAWQVENVSPHRGPTGKTIYCKCTVTSERSHEAGI